MNKQWFHNYFIGREKNYGKKFFFLPQILQDIRAKFEQFNLSMTKYKIINKDMC